jgi:hypothetical protein|tara:strand:- start:574 stop:930 length:357 start_codon:yes stop_codon:yes gene_type:complete
MAGFTRVNGLNATVGTIHSESCKAFLITVQNASNADIDLRAEDDAVDETVEMILKEVNPLMFSVKDNNSGEIHIVTDVSLSAADIQSRIRNLGTAVGPNNIDVTGSDVAEATAITIAG